LENAELRHIHASEEFATTNVLFIFSPDKKNVKLRKSKGLDRDRKIVQDFVEQILGKPKVFCTQWDLGCILSAK
jgi:hypothetical protein